MYRANPALISNFEIKFVLNNGRNKFAFRYPCGLHISPLSRVKFKILLSWVEKYLTHEQLKENLYISITFQSFRSIHDLLKPVAFWKLGYSTSTNKSETIFPVYLSGLSLLIYYNLTSSISAISSRYQVAQYM